MKNGCYTFEELQKKFNWCETTMHMIKQQIAFAKVRGINIEPAFKSGKTYFRILQNENENFENEIWKEHPDKNLDLEVSNCGRARTKTTQRLIGHASTKNNYVIIKKNNTQYQLHRLIMETFFPKENSNVYYVDHIDGNRSNNALNNLRWVEASENLAFRNENWQIFGPIFQKLLQKYGYKETKDKLLSLLKEN